MIPGWLLTQMTDFIWFKSWLVLSTILSHFVNTESAPSHSSTINEIFGWAHAVNVPAHCVTVFLLIGDEGDVLDDVTPS